MKATFDEKSKHAFPTSSFSKSIMIGYSRSLSDCLNVRAL